MTRTGLPGILLVVAPVFATAQGNPKPATPPQVDRRVIYREAREAIPALPKAFIARYYFTLATSERIHYPDDALTDFRTAFQAALDLRAPAGDEDEAATYLQIKTGVEAGTITGLSAQEGGFAIARALVREADVPRGPLYDTLIAQVVPSDQRGCFNAMLTSAAMMNNGPGMNIIIGGVNRGAAPTKDNIAACVTAQKERPPVASLEANQAAMAAIAPKEAPTADVLELSRECFAADGTYPYKGVWMSLEALPLSQEASMNLLRDIYKHAGDDLAPPNEAVGVLEQGHVLAPQLDSELLSAAISALTHLQDELNQVQAGRPNTAIVANGRKMMALVGVLNADRAAELASQMPSFAAGPASVAPNAAPRPAPNPPTPQAMSDRALADLTSVNALPSDTDQQTLMKFNQLYGDANAIARTNPGAAQAPADAAARLVNDYVLANNVRNAAMLAALLHRLGEHQAALDLMDRCYQSIEDRDVEFDKDFPTAASDLHRRYELNANITKWGSDTNAVFAVGSVLDQPTAVRHAETTRAVAYKPEMLLSAAAALPSTVAMVNGN